MESEEFMYEYCIEEINLNDTEQKTEVERFLKSFNLILDKDVDYTIVLKSEDKIFATCSKAENVLKCFAVSEQLRGEGFSSILINKLIDKCFEEGIYHSFIFTKPENIQIFSSLNFKLITTVDKASILEYGITDISKYFKKLTDKYNVDTKAEKTSLVMNCNPFTLGHQFLIEKASSENDEVVVFIVEEDRSLFPFEVRLKLVKEGTKHLENVKIIPGGEYIISSATFPSYFLRQEDERLTTFTELDSDIFGKYHCKALNITKRYVGDEPYCKVTACYNKILKSTLKKYNVQLVEIKRKDIAGCIVSASKVRDLIKLDNLKEVKKFVPKCTWDFLNSTQGKEIVEIIKQSSSPH